MHHHDAAEHASALGATVLGYPRIGPGRELKLALESYWRGDTARADLDAATRDLRQRTWAHLRDAGLDSVPGNAHTLYDHVLDVTTMLGAIPPRFASLGLDALDTSFAMARGARDAEPLELTKWFDSNYHYLVPEIGPDTPIGLADDLPVRAYREAAEAGVPTRPTLVGPVSYLLLASPAPDAQGYSPLERLDDVIAAYATLLSRLYAEGAEWVQLDEPAFVADRGYDDLTALARAYRELGERQDRPNLLVAAYYGDLGPALATLAASPVEALALDLVEGAVPGDRDDHGDVSGLHDKAVVAGVVHGRNVWRTDLAEAGALLERLETLAGGVAVGSSCPLLHVPHDVTVERNLPEALRARLAFADQKLAEITALARAHQAGEASSARTDDGSAAPAEAPGDPQVRQRLADLSPEDTQRAPFAERAAAQDARLGLPLLPTTTIGSFPQTREIRKARADHRAGRSDRATYEQAMRDEIARVVALQESVGLDVLVHGEPERNDMVQYFAEQLEGYASTEHGWVQSFGTAYVRPPILHDDVSRPAPMTVEWARYAQSLTDRPMKGMLTGPVTMLAWAFVRDDQPRGDTARQVALAIRDETRDLEAAGINVIQVDEPALRELLPLREADRPAYLDWAVEAFRLATAGVSDAVQVHTHMCYAEFGDVLHAIDDLDADVTSVEATRSRMAIVDELDAIAFERGIGPGVYDIHSPRVPSTEEIEELLRLGLDHIPAQRLWVNPDCGLKTRSYDEVTPALQHMVAAAQRLRAELGDAHG